MAITSEYHNDEGHNEKHSIEMDEKHLITIPLLSFIVLEVLTLLFGVCLCAAITGGILQLQLIQRGGIDKSKKYSGFRTLSDKHALTATETEID